MNIPPPTTEQARLYWRALSGVAAAVIVGLAGLVIWALGWLAQQLSVVLIPLALAGILTYLLDPVVDFFQARGVARTRAILLVFFLLVMSAAILLSTVVPRLVVETHDLGTRIPDYVRKLRDRVEESAIGDRIRVEWEKRTRPGEAGVETAPPSPDSELASRILAWGARVAPVAAAWVFGQFTRLAGLAGLVLGLFLVPVYTFYFLLEKKGISAGWTSYLPLRESRLKTEVIFILSNINECLVVFLRGQVLVALCSGTLLTVCFLLLGLNYALLLGVMAGVFGIIPYLGVMISLIPAVALAIVQFNNWWVPLIVIGCFALVNLLEGLVISPRIIGDRVGLHPLAVIVSVIVGTTLLGGLVGGLLAIPLTAALRAVMYRYVWQRPGAGPVDS